MPNMKVANSESTPVCAGALSYENNADYLDAAGDFLVFTDSVSTGFR
jgi:hypothetical protein